MNGHRLDLTSGDDFGRSDTAGQGSRKFVGIHFTCCDVYLRVYINSLQTAYQGRCPRCLRTIDIKIGAGGTNSRFFTVG